jgi:hypothetical protein
MVETKASSNQNASINKKLTNGGGSALCLLLSRAGSISVKEALHTTQSCSQGQSTNIVAASITTQRWKLPQKFMSHPCSFLRITEGHFTLEFQAFIRLTSSCYMEFNSQLLN